MPDLAQEGQARAGGALAGWVLDEAFLADAMARAAGVAMVSLDVFDTALTRLLESPVDAFAEIERRLVEAVGPAAAGYAQAREDAERHARLLHARLGGAEEIDLGRILEVLGQTMPALAGQLDLAAATELSVERSLLVAVPDILELTRRLAAAGTPYMFVSDMYLPADAIADLLRHAGFSGFQAVHVSSRTGATKASGRQWQVIRRDPASSAPILHIGDDPHADVEGPRAHGIETLLYARARSQRRAGGMLGPALLPFSRAARASALRGRADPAAIVRPPVETWHETGQVLGGIVLGGFLRWLEARVRLHRIDRLYFCARDGWLMQRAWKAAGLDRATGVEDRYLCVSRRPLNLARGHAQSTPGRLQPWLLAFLSSTDGSTSIRTALDRIGLSGEADILADLGARHVSIDAPLLWPDGVEAFRAALCRHSALVHARLGQSHAGLAAYLRQERLGAGGRCAIVDMGWHGTMQRSLRSLLEADGAPTPLVGFYYGLWPAASGNRYGAGVMESAFASDFIPGERQPELHEAVEILEELHAAPHGSVVSYRQQADGVWEPLFADSAAELRQYETVTRHFQDGTLSAIAALFATGRHGTLRLDELTPDAARAALGAICLSPSAEELALFGGLGHCATFDHARFDRLIPPAPADAAAMEQAFGRSGWRAGTLHAWKRDAAVAADPDRSRCLAGLAAELLRAAPRALRGLQ